MDFFEVVRKRRACHDFDPTYVLSDQQLEQLFEYVRLTPSGYNIQPWEFVVVRDQSSKEQLQKFAFNQKHVSECSAIILVVGDTRFADRAEETVQQWIAGGYINQQQGDSMKASLQKERSDQQLREMTIRNVGLVSMQLLLTAEAMGLATCPMMGFSKPKVADYLGLPQGALPGLMIAIGKMRTDVIQKTQLPRRTVADLVHFERYGA